MFPSIAIPYANGQGSVTVCSISLRDKWSTVKPTLFHKSFVQKEQKKVAPSIWSLSKYIAVQSILY